MGDAHVEALPHAETPARQEGQHVRPTEGVEGWGDWGGSRVESKAEDVMAWGEEADGQRPTWQPPRRWIVRADRQPCDTGG